MCLSRLCFERFLPLFVLSLVLLPACIIVIDDDDDDFDRLEDTEWELERLVVDGRARPITVGVYSLRFETDDDLRGVGDCNSYGASYRTGRDGALSIRNLVSTEIACRLGTLEPLYFDLLLATDTYRLRGDDLRLYDRRGDLLLHFRED